jgi:hypothetical protein
MKKLLLTSLLFGLLTLVSCQPPLVAPTVTLNLSTLTPIAGTELTLTATASDNVKQVEFFVDTTSLGIDSQAPYELILTANQVVAGNKSFKAVATDAANNSSQSVVDVTITSTDTTPPTVALSINPAVLIAGTAATLTAVVTDDTGIAQVEFFDGTTSLGIDTTEPFEQALAPAQVIAGQKTFKAIATDIGSNTAEASVDVTVQPEGTIPVVMTLTSSNLNPVEGEAFTLTAEIDNDENVKTVSFTLSDGNLLKDDFVAPYTLEVSGDQFAAGDKTIIVTAKNANNEIIAEASLTLTIAPNSISDISFTVKLKDIEVLGTSIGETPNTLQLVGSIKALLRDANTGVFDVQNLINLGSNSQLVINDIPFDAISKVLTSSNLPDLPDNVLHFIINLAERDGPFLSNPFALEVFDVAVVDLLKTTADAPFEVNRIVETPQGDKIKIFFEIVKN